VVVKIQGFRAGQQEARGPHAALGHLNRFQFNKQYNRTKENNMTNLLAGKMFVLVNYISSILQ